MRIRHKPSFVREFKKLPIPVQEDAFTKIGLFRDSRNHKQLKVHKLTGRLNGCYSFSVTYSHRIVFEYETPNDVVFLMIGDHDIYLK